MDIASSGNLFLYIMIVLVAEFYLMYVNYLARVRYKEYFKEQTRLWLELDKRGLTVLALILHFAFITGAMAFLASNSSLQFFAGVGCGLDRSIDRDR